MIYQSRLLNLTFIPNVEVVVSQAVDYAVTLPEVDPKRLIIWGRSFGGYLAPRAFAHEPRFSACVADGGIALPN